MFVHIVIQRNQQRMCRPQIAQRPPHGPVFHASIILLLGDIAVQIPGTGNFTGGGTETEDLFAQVRCFLARNYRSAGNGIQCYAAAQTVVDQQSVKAAHDAAAGGETTTELKREALTGGAGLGTVVGIGAEVSVADEVGEAWRAGGTGKGVRLLHVADCGHAGCHNRRGGVVPLSGAGVGRRGSLLRPVRRCTGRCGYCYDRTGAAGYRQRKGRKQSACQTKEK